GGPDRWRARAVVLGLRADRASTVEAIRLLEERRDRLTPSDEFFLAQLHHAHGDAKQVRVVMVNLLLQPDPPPLYVGFYARWLPRKRGPDALVRDIDVRDAEKLVDHLVTAQPDSFQTAELKARLLAAKKNPKEAAQLLLAQAEVPGAPLGRIATICEEIGL